jgi:hypothetical protein
MENYRNEESDARGPQEIRNRTEKRSVVIDFLGRLKNLKVAEEMADDETEEDETGDGHYRFLADGGLPETQAAGRKIYRSSAHGMYWSFRLP